MSTRVFGRLVVVVGVALGAGLGATGCLSGDDTVAPGGADAGRFDAAVPVFDAGGRVDAAPPEDSGADAPLPVDSGPPLDAGVDAPPPPPGDSGITGKAGLVAGGTLSKSPSYLLSGASGPATGIVLRSPKYQLVGGMAVTTK